MMFRSLILVGLLTTGCTVDTFASPSDSGDGGTQNDAQTGDGGQLLGDGGTSSETGADSALGFSLNGCTEASMVDMTAAGAVISWGAPVTPRCVKILKNQTVTWNGPFATDPLGSFGGDNGSPIVLTTSGASVKFTFTKTGAFGFHCLNHPSELGVVEVVE